MRNKGNLLKKISIVFAVLLAFLPNGNVFAKLTEAQLDMFAQNNILFYDPDGNAGGGCIMVGGANNFNYKGDEIFSTVEMAAVSAHRPFYESAAEKYNIPWQVLAVIHKREHSLIRSNPENGQGVYQLYSYTAGGTNENAFAPGPITDDEFQRQTDLMASLLATSYGKDLDLNTDAGIKRLFYNYNSGTGGATVYKNQALNMGFSEEEAESGEGSPYVMNRFDERRDPTVEPTKSNGTWGQIKTDGGSIEYPANQQFGAFTMFAALGGSSYYCAGGALVSGGFNSVESARTAIMDGYKDLARQYRNETDVEVDGAKLHNFCSGGPLANCVAFSKWFIARYTTAGNIQLPNGKDVVGALAGKYGFSDVMTEPRAYAIFSRQSGGNGCGHTGVVLGVDTDKGTMIIGEAGCGSSIDWIDAREVKISDYTSSDYTYVYTDGILKEKIGG